MPEQLTKHPEVTLQVLRSVGARCGEGAKQEILTKCPAERFCKLPGGEICVYGLPEAAKMTQIAPAEWRALLQSLPAPPAKTSGLGSGDVLLSGSGVLAFAVAAAGWSRWKRNRSPR